ncbi:MAG TPA: PfkB family carbohydrate kinase [Victivallales bacterium]|nr:PfkB family carbohydrate kinase [Victivallales bacterium]
MKTIDLKKALSDIKKSRIGVIGDFCLDVYWEINELKSEISVETGLQTRAVEFQKYSLGGAGNVVNNIYSLGVEEIKVFGVLGNDPFAYQMLALMKNLNVDTAGLLTQQDHWSTHVYTKPICKDAEENRIDFGNFNELSEETADNLLDILKKNIPSLDVIIINQQVISGLHSLESFITKLKKLIKHFPEKQFIVDSRCFSDKYDNILRKINDYEAATLCGYEHKPDDIIPRMEVFDSANKLYKKWQQAIFVTRGARGCIVIDESGTYEIPGLQIKGKLDTVGAGDSMLAGITSALSVGYKPEFAATFGNFVAGVTVQKLYITGTASPDEVIDIGASPDYIYNVEKAEDLRMAEYYDNSEIEIVIDELEGINISHIIFDHDGTISSLREGWEQIMEPMMIKSILGNKFESADETLYHRVLQRTKKFIDETTGIQTLTQMLGLVKLIKEFGIVPEHEILDEFGYKEIYNRDLIKLVDQRIAKFKRKELNVDDYVIKGSVEFLNLLHKNSIKLYLASGTDQDDVIAEAKALGYADLFEGRIYGAVGDVTKEAKRMVIDRILNDIGKNNFNKIAAIGDGPVEIREIKKRNGLAVGIASDEIRRFGLNQAKRSRLIKAGADMIISDYSQLNKLCKLLNIRNR